VTTMRLDDLGKSTTLESNKSHSHNRRNTYTKPEESVEAYMPPALYLFPIMTRKSPLPGATLLRRTARVLLRKALLWEEFL
jgi:hypothetical protein